jgi:hypothetical protein
MNIDKPTITQIENFTSAGFVKTTASGLLSVDTTLYEVRATNLTSFGALANAAGWLHNDGAGALIYSIPSKSDVGLSLVENTALSTWSGTSNITTLGTITACTGLAISGTITLPNSNTLIGSAGKVTFNNSITASGLTIGSLTGLLKSTAGLVSAITATTSADYLGGDLAFHTLPAGGSIVLATVSNINAKNTGTINLYTVPTGKTAVITNIVFRPTAVSSITSGPTVSTEITEDAMDIMYLTQLYGLNATNEAYNYVCAGVTVTGAATNVIKLRILVAAVGTSMTMAVDLLGYTF